MLQRYLTFGESWFIQAGVGAMFALTTVGGPIDPDIMRRSLTALMDGQPEFRGTVEHDGTGFLLRINNTAEPVVHVRSAAPDGLREELNAQPDPAVGLVRVCVIPDAERTTVALMMHHVIGDGQYLLAMNNALWAGYTALTQGREPLPPHRDELSEPMETRLAERFDDSELAELTGQSAPPTRQGVAAVTVVPDRAAAEHEVRYEVALVDADTTKVFTALAADSDVTVHALMTGTIMSALLPALADGDDAGPLMMNCASPVDLRSRVDPPVPPEAAASWVSVINTAIPVTRDDTPLALAHRVKTEFDAALAANLPEKIVAAGPRLSLGPGMEISFILTNLGRIAVPPMPRHTDFLDLQVCSNVLAPTLYFNAYTVDDRLRITVIYNHAHHTAERMRGMADRIEAAFLAAAGIRH